MAIGKIISMQLRDWKLYFFLLTRFLLAVLSVCAPGSGSGKASPDKISLTGREKPGLQNRALVILGLVLDWLMDGDHDRDLTGTGGPGSPDIFTFGGPEFFFENACA